MRVPALLSLSALCIFAATSSLAETSANTRELSAGNAAVDESFTIIRRPGIQNLENARRAKINKLHESARQFRILHEGKTSSPEAKEAKRREALLLLEAGLSGDDSLKTRRSQLVDELRGDVSISPVRRSQLVAMGLYADAKINKIASKSQRIEVIERTERSLIAEFPTAPNGYEGLLSLAYYSDDSKGHSLVKEIITMAGAPDFIKSQAKHLDEQYSLIDISLEDLLPELLARVHSERGGKQGEIVIYAWSAESKASLACAEFIYNRAPDGVFIVGVNIDTVKNPQDSTTPPGTHIYDTTGEIRNRLKWESAPQVYIVDSEGKIRSVSGMKEISREWTKNPNRARGTEGQK